MIFTGRGVEFQFKFFAVLLHIGNVCLGSVAVDCCTKVYTISANWHLKMLNTRKKSLVCCSRLLHNDIHGISQLALLACNDKNVEFEKKSLVCCSRLLHNDIYDISQLALLACNDKNVEFKKSLWSVAVDCCTKIFCRIQLLLRYRQVMLTVWYRIFVVYCQSLSR